MSTASERGWGYPGAPGSTAERTYRRLYITTIEIGGVRLAVRREVAHLFEGFISELLATGYRLDVNADDWGFANRDIRGRPGVKSNHAWGLAVDLNAIDNPMTGAHPDHAGDSGHDGRGVHTDMPAQTAALAAKWGLTWGANYSGSRKDAMHLEFVGTPQDVTKYPLRTTPRPTPTPPMEATGMKLITHPYTTGLDDQGRGHMFVPHRFDRVITVIAQGSAPERDGYWDTPVIGIQEDGAGTRVVITEAKPGGPVTFFVKTLEP